MRWEIIACLVMFAAGLAVYLVMDEMNRGDWP